jgi:hypothetical protein
MENSYSIWKDLIGAYMIKFAEAEYEIAMALLNLTPITYDNFKNISFRKRVNMFRNYIKYMRISSNNKSELHLMMDSLLELSDTRNTIAHNPIRMSLEGILSNQQLEIISSLRNQESIVTLEDLTSKLNILVELEERLHELLSNAEFSQ